MFLHELDPPQRDAFLTLAARLMSADALLHDDELRVMTLMRAELALPASWRPRTEATDALLDTFDTSRVRSIALLNLLRILHADQTFDPEEMSFIRVAARRFGFNAERVRALARWLSRHQALLDEGDLLLSV